MLHQEIAIPSGEVVLTLAIHPDKYPTRASANKDSQDLSATGLTAHPHAQLEEALASLHTLTTHTPFAVAILDGQQLRAKNAFHILDVPKVILLEAAPNPLSASVIQGTPTLFVGFTRPLPKGDSIHLYVLHFSNFVNNYPIQ